MVVMLCNRGTLSQVVGYMTGLGLTVTRVALCCRLAATYPLARPGSWCRYHRFCSSIVKVGLGVRRMSR
jgi:hypothetical protein